MIFFWNLIFFVIALGVLVSIHEYGHFWVARKLGVRVLTFSFGFGKPLLQKIGKDGVRYVISAIPLGGYVKMLDERESDQGLAKEDQPFAFNRKPVWVRIAIVLAGPMANFLLAILLYWIMFVIGIKGLVPEIGQPPLSSIAQQAGLEKGDRILAVDGIQISVMDQLTKSIARRLGENGEMTLTVRRKQRSDSETLRLNLSSWNVDEDKPDILHSLGIFHQIENGHTLLGEVTAGKSADKAGIKVGDKILSIDGISVRYWREMGQLIQSMPNKTVLIEVERNGELMPISVVIGSAEENGVKVGKIGVGGVPGNYQQYYVNRQFGAFESLGLAIDEMFEMVTLTTQLFKKLLVAEISVKSLSGPASIAEGAGNSASIGLVYFISFLAMISVNLGFINLLPVPMLDGGHLLYFVIEAIKGKPLSEKVQEIGLQVGMMMVFALMAIAIFNDISRF